MKAEMYCSYHESADKQKTYHIQFADFTHMGVILNWRNAVEDMPQELQDKFIGELQIERVKITIETI